MANLKPVEINFWNDLYSAVQAAVNESNQDLGFTLHGQTGVSLTVEFTRTMADDTPIRGAIKFKVEVVRGKRHLHNTHPFLKTRVKGLPLNALGYHITKIDEALSELFVEVLAKLEYDESTLIAEA